MVQLNPALQIRDQETNMNSEKLVRSTKAAYHDRWVIKNAQGEYLADDAANIVWTKDPARAAEYDDPNAPGTLEDAKNTKGYIKIDRIWYQC